MTLPIRIEGLRKSYGRKAVLRGIDLHCEAGTVTAVLGSNGSGKSTLLSLLAGLDTPTSGRIQVADSPIHEMNQDALALWRGKNVGRPSVQMGGLRHAGQRDFSRESRKHRPRHSTRRGTSSNPTKRKRHHGA